MGTCVRRNDNWFADAVSIPTVSSAADLISSPIDWRVQDTLRAFVRSFRPPISQRSNKHASRPTPAGHSGQSTINRVRATESRDERFRASRSRATVTRAQVEHVPDDKNQTRKGPGGERPGKGHGVVVSAVNRYLLLLLFVPTLNVRRDVRGPRNRLTRVGRPVPSRGPRNDRRDPDGVTERWVTGITRARAPYGNIP